MKSTVLLWIGATMLLGASLVTPPMVRAELDHLTCFPAKDEDAVKVNQDIILKFNIFNATVGCTVKGKPKFFCLNSEKNLADDPRGPELLADFACYQVKCEKGLGIGGRGGSQFDPDYNIHAFSQDAKILCAPIAP